MRSNPKKCVLVLSSEPAGHEVSLPCDFFGPAIPNLPKKHRRFRAVHPFLEAVCHDAEGRIRFFFKAELSEPRSLDDLATLLDLIRVMVAPRVRFRLIHAGTAALAGSGNAAQAMPFARAIPFMVAFVHFLRSNTRPHDLPDDLRLSLSELAQQMRFVQQYMEIATGNDLSGTCSTTPLTTKLPTRSGKAIATPWVSVAGHTIYAIVKRDLAVEQKDCGALTFALGRIHYARVRILRGDFESTANEIARETDACLREIPDEMVIFFPPRSARQRRRGGYTRGE